MYGPNECNPENRLKRSSHIDQYFRVSDWIKFFFIASRTCLKHGDEFDFHVQRRGVGTDHFGDLVADVGGERLGFGGKLAGGEYGRINLLWRRGLLQSIADSVMDLRIRFH